MSKYVVAMAEEIPPGERRVVSVNGRPIVVFNLSGQYYALLNACPHQRAELARGIVAGITTSDEPGHAECQRSGEFIRCPWHGWEFDIRTGQSWTEPERYAVRQFAVSVEAGARLVEGPYKAETFPVTVDGEYVVVEV
ncbi:MAG: Rieske (2Fe-2S) protein [Dehalococcoidia bacterium]